MSMEYMLLAMKAKVGNHARKLVLLKLADNACDRGECWPSYQYIADQCEMSKRTAMRHIDQLVTDGLITKEARKGSVKGNRSNVYLLDKEQLKSRSIKSTPSDNMTLPPSDNVTLPLVTECHPPSDNVTLPPSDNVSPITYHSLEPINESKDIEPKGSGIYPDQVKNLFNSTCEKLSSVLKINDKRKKAIKKLSSELLKTPSDWQAYFLKINASDFLNGATDWQASFDWVLVESNCLKILERNYDNRAQPINQNQNTTKWYEDLGI